MAWVLFIVGPTASGKSAWALDLAIRWNGTVVNADSRQFYRDARIGTACPPAEWFRQAPHRLYAFLPPDQQISAGAYARMAWAVIRGCWRSGRLPIVVGGSGLYYRAVRYGLHPPVGADPSVRRHLEQRYRQEGLTTLYMELQAVDPTAARRIHPNDARRVLRALEIYYQTGEPPSRWRPGWRRPVFPSIALGLLPPPNRLREQIVGRNREFWSMGWLDEVVQLIERGVSLDAPVFEPIGYRGIAGWWQAGRPVPEADLLAQVDREGWNLARRQIKWFRREPDVLWWTEPPPLHVVERFIRPRLLGSSGPSTERTL
ncbi:MAG: tRNA (adenosine(37)-N6)-dimethylallyltransferase MiaA [Acidobacteria bacterium]|nr:tRNA (adenosine(37)-N6)-dimethylallyltransferase MiaA [Acidobacteriota bacterium]MDW7985262.1 tRNA (adenosine(37)-N6)-dimethylallyltransferase MiaA [Acidobacteriota bacterium]